MSSEKPEKKPFLLHHRLIQILDVPGSRGAFLGEDHHHPALRQALGHLLPLLKAKGVGCMSLEIPQHSVEVLLKARSCEEWLKNDSFAAAMPAQNRPEEIFKLVKQARAMGMKVIGHEDPDVNGDMAMKSFLSKHFPAEMQKLEKTVASVAPEKRQAVMMRERAKVIAKLEDSPALQKAFEKIQDEYSPTIAEGFDRRDRFAAGHIHANWNPKTDGKLFVLGGASHSHASDIRMNKGRTLSRLLGLEAIVVQAPAPGKTIQVGVTQPLKDGGYSVELPPDLKAFFEQMRKNTGYAWPSSGDIRFTLPVKPVGKNEPSAGK